MLPDMRIYSSVLLLSLCQVSVAQNTGTTTHQITTKRVINVWNSDQDDDVHLHFSWPSCSETTYHLLPSRHDNYWCESDNNVYDESGTVLLKTRHPDESTTEIRYKLRTGNRYEVFYNGDIDAWDIVFRSEP
jgi:hypothetical protein